MTRLKYLFAIGAGFAAGGSVNAAAPTESPLPAALASLQPGQWALRSRDGSAPTKMLCLGDPRVLLQVRHSGPACSKVVLSNLGGAVVANYSCVGGSNGRTEIRVETPRVIQIESQGIEAKAPFEWSYEGRRVGECPIAGPIAQR